MIGRAKSDGKNIGTILLLTVLYKTFLEVSFWKVLTVDYPFYEFSFNVFKYVNGLLWMVIMLLPIRYERRSASTFFVFLLVVMQMIPITIIYAQTNGMSPVYYNLLCGSFLMCEMIVGRTKNQPPFLFIKHFSQLLIPFFLVVSFLVVAIIIKKNGMPTSTALNVFNVYELRRNGSFQIGKYTGYLLDCVMTVFLPVIMIKSINSNSNFFLLVSMVCLLLIYLYTGHKTYLFSIGLCIFGAVVAKQENAFGIFYKLFFLAIILISILAMVLPGENNIAVLAYSLLVRRALFVPSELKFLHYDYFTYHPHLWLYGSIPVAINPYIPQYYTTHNYPFDIGFIYFNEPLMSADTGFFIEGYARFGYVGLVLSFVFLAIILKKIDAFQERTSYSTAVSFFIYPMYALAETQILGNIVLGSWMFLFVLLNHYEEKQGLSKNGNMHTQKIAVRYFLQSRHYS